MSHEISGKDISHLYLSEIESHNLTDEFYLYYFKYKNGAAIFSHGGVSKEYLQGYLDGAIVYRWSEVNVVNGMSTDITKQIFPQLNLHPLSKEKLEDLLKGTSLPLHYPELLETR